MEKTTKELMAEKEQFNKDIDDKIYESMQVSMAKSRAAKAELRAALKKYEDDGWCSSRISPHQPEPEPEPEINNDLDNFTEGSNYIEIIAKPIEPPLEVLIEEKREIAEEMRKVAADMNNETNELIYLAQNHNDWIEQYRLEEGGNAIWQGHITKGFMEWCKDKGYQLGENNG